MNERIKTLRASLGLTQAAFGKRLNLSQNFVWMLERGDRSPSDRTVADICREFGVREAWLRDGDGDMLAAAPGESPLRAAILAAVSNAPESELEAIRSLAGRILAETEKESRE